ncbi:hypothetical protein [Nocardia arthritidis]|uniref:Uncharacterized protein n=1 Tax=Nocardia arthritidis TaxID=228602 RepID=A0A6G9YBR3_9NOCA|nr:hypothetical protein [Nocardia arthritidis]QIS10608.1 hypothetical protein F5544_13600 [Nocardia arthritidis]
MSILLDHSQEVLRRGRLDLVSQLGFSETPPAYPEDQYMAAYLERGTEPIWATYSLLGVEQWTRDGWQISYFLDRGIEICGIATDFMQQAYPKAVSLLCALGRYNECPGAYRPCRLVPVVRVPCRCGCGCRERSQRRRTDDRGDQPTDELNDIDPNGKSGNVTHDEPPEAG